MKFSIFYLPIELRGALGGDSSTMANVSLSAYFLKLYKFPNLQSCWLDLLVFLLFHTSKQIDSPLRLAKYKAG